MEGISASAESAEQDYPKPPTNHAGPKSCKKKVYLCIVVFCSLLGVLLVTRLEVHYSIMTVERDSLNANLSTVSKKLAIITEERDLLRANLSENLKELERLQSLCEEEWARFGYNQYLLSVKSGSWNVGRKECRHRGADLVVIDSPAEQHYLARLTHRPTWIGLTDEEEGKWKWVDGTPLNLTYWSHRQPDNGGGDTQWGEEDCVHIRTDADALWNDLSCDTPLPWVCEKKKNNTNS